MRQLLVATRNSNKTREIREILGDAFLVSDLSSHEELPVIEESGATFLENAELKAVDVSRHFPGLVLSDDSGLEVDALGGAPGVRSARYAGNDAGDEQNRRKLISELDRVSTSAGDRSARFRCAMALAQNGKVVAAFQGEVEGVIVTEPKGTGGFGYDPLFVPHGYTETFAQLPLEVKNRESHRGRALRQAVEFLRSEV
jgi:XTP/dITP diphosphohydrolase